ncbi:MAG: hypothetical protein M3069_01345, partial [Chloroflexota bacterium]|nr:hypothetical protein [Chloroflexota bacterium]
MNRFVRSALLPCVLALASLPISVAPAFADLDGTTAYEIEAKEQYCASGGTECAVEGQQPNLATLRFAMLELYRMTPSTQDPPGGSVALPDVMLAKCAGAHWMDAKGNIHAPVMFVYAGPTAMHFDGGTISGNVNLSQGRESDMHSVATISMSASDPMTGDSAIVVGTQVANNTNSARVKGGFTITLDGRQFDEIVAGPDSNPEAMPTPTGQGHMTCSTDHPPVQTRGTPPPYFENEVNGPP